jgi:hypothetical protein
MSYCYVRGESESQYVAEVDGFNATMDDITTNTQVWSREWSSGGLDY